MRFKSTRADNAGSAGAEVSFKDAVLRCLPQEGGLYVPSGAVDLRQFFLYMNEDTSYPELVAAVTPALLQGELNPFAAAGVAESACVFEPELRQLDEQFSLLNLFHGPTGVFKDFGIAFLAAVLEELLKDSGRAMTLSAARGDTGVSIAHAFRGSRRIVSALLYPAGPVLGLESASFVPNGGSVIPLQVNGTFDDCQRLVTETINDRSFSGRHHVTSANAINPGRLLPQSFYFLYAFIKIKKRLKDDLVFSVPSGNFGNLMAGLYAWKFGMPVNGFIAAMNANDAFGDFIRGRGFTPGPLVNTNSPALDVSLPSNYERLLSFYDEAPAVMRNMVYPASIDDAATAGAMERAWKVYGALLDPHSAVAFAAARRFAEAPENKGRVHVVILATGHPAKEAALVRAATGQNAVLPEKLALLRRRAEPLARIEPHLEALEGAIASCV
ncbi:MAG: threonine synthase [Treponematales bacterium]